MDIQPGNQQSISDDQELAKVLAGVSNQPDEVAAVPAPVVDDAATAPVADDPAAVEPAEVELPPIEAPAVVPAPVSDSLDGVKQEAITELRPLVDKLDLPPEEKFDTYLLLLRSTDDKTLIPSAHEAAKNIPDEARRAQALLDIIKEIDYLSGQKTA